MTKTLTKKALRVCPVCGCFSVDVIHTLNFALPECHPLARSYDIVSCTACGFIYADTTSKQSDYDLFYSISSIYEDTEIATGGGRCWWDLERIKSTAGRIAGFLSGDKEKRILDVGCANGGLLGCLKELGFANLHGIDPSRACVENTRKLGIDAFSASLFHLPGDLGVFDCVILSHVLEHVHDLQSALQITQGLLKPQGLVYVEVPDALRYQHYLVAPFQEFNTEHINHFTLSSLHNLLSANGYHRKLSGKDEILSAPGKNYPIAFAFYEKSGITDPVGKDVNALHSIRSYIARSQDLLNQMEMKLSKLSTKEIIVWGAGQLTMKLLAETSLGCKNIAAFVDNNPVTWGKKIKGVPVISPLVLKERKLFHPIIIATTLHQESIIEQIRNLDLRNTVITLT